LIEGRFEIVILFDLLLQSRLVVSREPANDLVDFILRAILALRLFADNPICRGRSIVLIVFQGNRLLRHALLIRKGVAVRVARKQVDALDLLVAKLHQAVAERHALALH
jgi:hypothetical protein